MNFGFSEEQTMLRKLAREILEQEVTPERRKRIEASSEGFDRELWSRLAEANLLGLAVPEEFGGMGFGFLELVTLLEEVGRTVAPVPVLAALVLGGLPLARFGTGAQRERWLGRLATGEAILSAGLVDADSDEPEAPALRARPRDSGYVLDGRKRFVPFAAYADRLLVPAQSPDGVGIFLVDPAADGVELTRHESSVGEPGFDLVLAGARVGADERLGGDEADGRAIARWLYEHALVATSRLRARARAVRGADRLVPGRAAPLCRCLHRRRGDPLVHLARGLATRRGSARGARSGGGEVLGRGGGLAHRRRRPASARRHRRGRRLSDPPVLSPVQVARARPGLGDTAARLAGAGHGADRTAGGRVSETLRFEQVSVGDELPLLDVELSAAIIVGGALASRDFTPVHHSRAAAQAQGMSDVFMNILTTNGYVGRYVTDWAGVDAILENVAIKLGAPKARPTWSATP
jgi:alkylation response protein AidB-like acyl-CoA dehydrogenase